MPTRQVRRSRPFGSAILRWSSQVGAHLFRRQLGWIFGHRFVLLTHTGRRRGTRHDVMLEVVQRERGRNAYVVVAGFGKNADWLRNLEANGLAEISVGRTRFAATPRRLGQVEGASVLAAYEQEHRWLRPVVRRLLSRLLGWAYDGSLPSRLRAARQLPFVEFTPRSS